VANHRLSSTRKPFLKHIVTSYFLKWLHPAGRLIFVRDRQAHKDFIYRKLLEYLD